MDERVSGLMLHAVVWYSMLMLMFPPPPPVCMYHASRADRETHLNANYELCGSYPSVLVVPASVTDDEIIAVSQFRSEQRLPVLCWGRQADSASIWRSSQPKVGSGRVWRRCRRVFD